MDDNLNNENFNNVLDDMVDIRFSETVQSLRDNFAKAWRAHPGKNERILIESVYKTRKGILTGDYSKNNSNKKEDGEKSGSERATIMHENSPSNVKDNQRPPSPKQNEGPSKLSELL